MALRIEDLNQAVDPAIVSLVTERCEIKNQIKRLTDRLSSIDEELKTELVNGDIVYGATGVGVKLSTTQSLVYKQSAIDALDAMGLLPYFAKVSTTGLERLVKQGHIDKYVTAQLMANHAEMTQTLVLREVVLDEAKIA